MSYVCPCCSNENYTQWSIGKNFETIGWHVFKSIGLGRSKSANVYSLAEAQDFFKCGDLR